MQINPFGDWPIVRPAADQVAAIRVCAHECLRCLSPLGDGEAGRDRHAAWSDRPAWLPVAWRVATVPPSGGSHLAIGMELRLRDADRTVYISHGESVDSNCMSVRWLLTADNGALPRGTGLLVAATVFESQAVDGRVPYPIADFLESAG